MVQKYFGKCKSIEELKKLYKKLALENHPDRGGSEDVMKEINEEFEFTFKLFGNKTTETADSFRSNFYSANGWQGKNYRWNRSTKEITALIRAYVKMKYPKFKFHVNFESAAWTSSIHVSLIEGYVPLKDSSQTHISINQYYIERHENALGTEIYKMIFDVNEYIKSYHYDDSDIMTDYFDCNFYYNISVGEWNYPYTVNPKLADKKTKYMENVA